MFDLKGISNLAQSIGNKFQNLNTTEKMALASIGNKLVK
jgi:hypothetical protein